MQEGGILLAPFPSGNVVPSASSFQGASTSAFQGTSSPAFQGGATPGFQGPSNSAFQGASNPPRQRFQVELKEGETNVVSWKKLLKDAQKSIGVAVSEAPAGANPALEARIAPERQGILQASIGAGQEPVAPPRRFSSVIEKIERLYKGRDSDDEPEDVSADESQYDTEDDFIDDSELNKYFSVQKAKTKHTGFFVNKGKLEKLVLKNEAPVSPPIPKKRKRKDMKKLSGEKVEDGAKKRQKTGVMRLKDAARKVLPSNVAAISPSEKPIIDEKYPVTNFKQEGVIDTETATYYSNHTRKEISRDLPMEDSCKIEPNSKSKNGVQKSHKEEKALDLDSDSTTESDAPIPTVKRTSQKGIEGGDINTEEKKKMKLTIPSCEDKERQMKDVSKDIKGSIVLHKVKKNQLLAKEEERRESNRNPTAVGTSSPGPKEVSPGKRTGWPKGTVLERAINDLEKGVAEFCPPTADGQVNVEALSGGKNKRLPREVKQKLAKVARLGGKQGKFPDELVERLMSILGHIIQTRTLKRNLKAMVEMGLSAKQEKEMRLLNMKREVTEMVWSRVTSDQAQDAEQREGSSDDFQAASGSAERGRYRWDHPTEDRICDLYDKYVEGMDEHKGPQIRKLYAELAELWPDGLMDNIGIKNAVFRSKERKKKLIRGKMADERKGKQKAPLVTDKQRNDGGLTDKNVATTPGQAHAPLSIKAIKRLDEPVAAKQSLSGTGGRPILKPVDGIKAKRKLLGPGIESEKIKRLRKEGLETVHGRNPYANSPVLKMKKNKLRGIPESKAHGAVKRSLQTVPSKSERKVIVPHNPKGKIKFTFAGKFIEPHRPKEPNRVL